MLTQAQIDFRKTGIGASESAAILGVHPYLSAMELYARKIGLSLDEPKNIKRLWWGSVAEALVLDRYQIDHPEAHVLRTTEALHCHRHPGHPEIIANLDGAVGAVDSHILEVKTVGSRAWWLSWENGKQVPLYIQVQCQHQMLVTGAKRNTVLALVDYELHELPIERDDAFIEKLRRKIVGFWADNVQAKVPPMWDGSTSCYEALKTMHPAEDAAGLVSLPDLQDVALEYRALGEQERVCKGRRKEIKNEILATMGDHKTADIGDGFTLARDKRNTIKIKEPKQ